MSELNFHKPKNFSEVVSDTFEYVKSHYKLLLKVLLIYVAPLFLVQSILVASLDLNPFRILEDPDNPDIFREIFGLRYLASIAISLIANCVLSVLVLRHVGLVAHNEEFNSSVLTQYLFIYAANFFVLYFFIGLIVSLSAIFFIIPAIFIGVQLSLAPAVLQIEQNGILNAMSRSWALVRGNWWLTFGIIVVMYIIVSFIVSILTIPSILASTLFVEFGMMDSGTLSWIIPIVSAVTTIITSLLYTIFHIALAVHYFSLKEQKEGGTLFSKINQIR